MKLNTLYKSVVEYASVAVLVRLIPTPDHELRLSDHYVRMRVVGHSLATYGANTTRSAVPLIRGRRLRHVIHYERTLS